MSKSQDFIPISKNKMKINPRQKKSKLFMPQPIRSSNALPGMKFVLDQAKERSPSVNSPSMSSPTRKLYYNRTNNTFNNVQTPTCQ